MDSTWNGISPPCCKKRGGLLFLTKMRRDSSFVKKMCMFASVIILNMCNLFGLISLKM